jgi:hypothetical protein
MLMEETMLVDDRSSVEMAGGGRIKAAGGARCSRNARKNGDADAE